MIKNRSKRDFIKKMGLSLTGLFLLNVFYFRKAKSNYKPKVVIIGGGVGGASCLRYLSDYSNFIELSIIEKNKNIQTCPFSNLVIGGLKNHEDIVFETKSFYRKKINFVNDYVNKIDIDNKKILLNDKSFLNYDFLILSPGISYKWENIFGLKKNDPKILPHSWDGDKNLHSFKKRIDDLENNSTIIISSPDYPYRCPPAPYERASLIANYLIKKRKKFKILILDSKDSFTKKKLFIREWDLFYKNKIEWVSRSDGGQVVEIDSNNKIVKTKNGQKYKGDIIHIIPDQKASDLFFQSKLISNDWCNVNPVNFELNGFKDIYVLGDSIDAWDMPKSAFSANSQSKALSQNLVNRILEKEYINPAFLNTCYSFSAPERAFSISSWYRLNSEKNRIVSLGTKESDVNASDYQRKKETIEAYGWYESLTKEIYG
tara:strand:+ start:121 stop:1410 length:1290 start_codon:yes stop_codon:yes gene_type:complete